MNNMPNITVVKQTVTVNSRYLWDSTNQEWLAKAHPESQWRSLMQMVLEL